MIVGATDSGTALLRAIRYHPHVNYRVIGFIDDRPDLARCRIEGVPVGTATLNAWGVGRNAGQQAVKDLTAGEVRDGIELKMAAGVELSGVATDESGAPARFKSLMAMSLQTGQQGYTQTAADGSFKFTNIGAGQVRISAGGWEANLELAVVTAPASDVRVTWKEPPAQVIEGTVLDPQGKPVPLCQVSIRTKAKFIVSRVVNDMRCGRLTGMSARRACVAASNRATLLPSSTATATSLPSGETLTPSGERPNARATLLPAALSIASRLPSEASLTKIWRPPGSLPMPRGRWPAPIWRTTVSVAVSITLIVPDFSFGT